MKGREGQDKEGSSFKELKTMPKKRKGKGSVGMERKQLELVTMVVADPP